MVGGQAATVKIPMKKLSPRAAVICRQLLLQLINSHLALRIVEFDASEKVQTARSYKALKLGLNSLRSTRQFMLNVVESWTFASTEGPPASCIPSSPPMDSTDIQVFRQSVPKSRRLQFFNTNVIAKRARLSDRDHARISVVPSKRCLCCSMLTTVKCNFCTVHLCSKPFGNNRKSCWYKFHNTQKVCNALDYLTTSTLTDAACAHGSTAFKKAIESSAVER